jgi:hypothetical protein
MVLPPLLSLSRRSSEKASVSRRQQLNPNRFAISSEGRWLLNAGDFQCPETRGG